MIAYSKESVIAEAIRLTFDNRSTTIPVEIEAFTERFTKAKQIQWTAFAKRINQEHIPVKFQDIISELQSFLYPLASALSHQSPIPKKWSSENQWSQEN